MTRLARGFASLAAAAAFASGAYGLLETFRFRDVNELALAIEQGQRMSPARAVAVSTDSALTDASRHCGRAGQASVSVYLGILDAVPEQADGAFYTVARGAVEHALRCDPMDGNLWLRRAMILMAQHEVSGSLSSLRLSARFAPTEGWIVTTRALFTQSLVSRGMYEVQDDFRRDAQIILRYGEDAAVAKIYSTPAPWARLILREGATLTPLDRRRRLEQIFDEADDQS